MLSAGLIKSDKRLLNISYVQNMRSKMNVRRFSLTSYFLGLYGVVIGDVQLGKSQGKSTHVENVAVLCSSGMATLFNMERTHESECGTRYFGTSLP